MKTFHLVNLDTDSFSIYDPNRNLKKEDVNKLLDELNSTFPEGLVWEDDGFYSCVVVLKAKNYAMYSDGKVKIKGSAFKSSSRETALKELMVEFLDVMLKEDLQGDTLYTRLLDIYHKYIKEALNVKDIKRWSSKKTLTTKVLSPERTNEQKIYNAIQGTEYAEGDKKWLYFKPDGSLGITETFDGVYDEIKLIEKIWKTIKVFETILDIKKFPKYNLKKMQHLLTKLKE